MIHCARYTGPLGNPLLTVCTVAVQGWCVPGTSKGPSDPLPPSTWAWAYSSCPGMLGIGWVIFAGLLLYLMFFAPGMGYEIAALAGAV